MSPVEIGAWSLLVMVLLVVSGLHIAVALILVLLSWAPILTTALI